MKTRLTKNYLAAAVSILGLSALLAFTPTSGSAQGAPEQMRGDRIEGVWDSQVNIVDCDSGTVIAGFRGLGMFIRGGSLTQTNNMPPALSSPSMGRWQKLGSGHYIATFRFFRFLPDGSYTGTQKVTRDIQLDVSGNTFTSGVSFETSDTAGNVIATGCGTETSVRVVD